MRPSFLKIVCLATSLFILTYNITSNAEDYHDRYRQLMMDYIRANNARGVSQLIYTRVNFNIPSRGTGLLGFLYPPTTPLIAAVLTGNKFIVDTLLEAKIDPNVRDEYGRLPLTLAIKQNKLEIAKSLTLKADLSLPDEHGDTPLIWAAEHAPHPGFIKILLDAGANPNAQNSEDGHTALMKAVWNHQYSKIIVEMLLKAGANLILKMLMVKQH